MKDLTPVKQGILLQSKTQDISGKCLTEEREMLNKGQNTALSCTITKPMEIHQYWAVPRQTQRMTTPFFTKKCRLQYNHWRKGSQPELTTSLQNWSKQVGKTTICNKLWQTGEWLTPWTQSLVITLPKKGNLQQCQNYRTIGLISHSSKFLHAEDHTE